MHKSVLFSFAVAFLLAHSLARAQGWQPSSGHVQVPIWPGPVPNALPHPKPESADSGGGTHDVSQPTMTMYGPKGRNTGVAVVVFPGGGYLSLAMSGEGTEICDWLTSRGITCGGHLVAAVSTHFNEQTYPPVDAADQLTCRPDFAVAVYPGHLWAHEDEDHATRNEADLKIRSDISVRADTPPTFLLQAEDDHVDGVEQSLAYYVALQKAGVPTEMHLYAQGGHAFGLTPSKLPIAQWPRLVEAWLVSIGMADAVPKASLPRNGSAGSRK